MDIAMLIIGIILLVFAVFLIVAVLMQQGKSHNLSGTIAGGAETFFGKSKAQTINKKLSILTSVVAIVFVVLVCVVYIIQPNSQSMDDYGSFWEYLFDNGEEETMGGNDVVEHDHDGDGVADHTADAHTDETTAAVEETTAVVEETTAAEETTVAAE